MTDLDRNVLLTLRIFGPMSNAMIARRLKLPLHQTYLALGELVASGLADHPKRQVWSLSPSGALWFSLAPIRPLVVFVAPDAAAGQRDALRGTV